MPAVNYTPYRTMTGLPGMQMSYRAWEVICRACVVATTSRSLVADHGDGRGDTASA